MTALVLGVWCLALLTLPVTQALFSILQPGGNVILVDQHINQYHDGISSHRNLSFTFRALSCGRQGGQNISIQLNDTDTGLVINVTLRCFNRVYEGELRTIELVPEMAGLMEREECGGQYGRNETFMPPEVTAESLFSGTDPVDLNGNLITNVSLYLEELAQAQAARGPLPPRTDLAPLLPPITLVNTTVAGQVLGVDLTLPPTLLTSGVYINGTNGSYANPADSSHPSHMFHVSKTHQAHLLARQSRHQANRESAREKDPQFHSLTEAYHHHYRMFQHILSLQVEHLEHVHAHHLFTTTSPHHTQRRRELDRQRRHHRYLRHLNRYGHVQWVQPDYHGKLDEEELVHDQKLLDQYAKRTFQRSSSLLKRQYPSSFSRHLQSSSPFTGSANSKLVRTLAGGGSTGRYTQGDPHYPVRSVEDNRNACITAIMNAASQFTGLSMSPTDLHTWLLRQTALYLNWQLIDDPNAAFYVPEATCSFLNWDSLNASQRLQLPDTIGVRCLPRGFTEADVRASAYLSDDDFFNPGNFDARPFQAKILDALVWGRDKNTQLVSTTMSPASLFKSDPSMPCPCGSRNQPTQRVCPLNPYQMRNLSKASGPSDYINQDAAVGGVQMECGRLRGQWFCQNNEMPSMKRDVLPQTVTTCCVGDPNCDDEVKNRLGTTVPSWFSQIHDNNLPAGVSATGEPPRTDWFSRNIACPVVNFFTGHSACECQKVTYVSTNYGALFRDDFDQATNNLQDVKALEALYSGLENGFEAAKVTRAQTLAGTQLAMTHIDAVTQLAAESMDALVAQLQDVSTLLTSSSSIQTQAQSQKNHIESIFSGLQQNISATKQLVADNEADFDEALSAIQSILSLQSQMISKMQGQLTTATNVLTLIRQFKSFTIQAMNRLLRNRNRFRQVLGKLLPALRETKVKYGMLPFVSDGPDADFNYGIASSPPPLDKRSLLVDVVRAMYIVDTGHLHQRTFALYCSPGFMQTLLDVDLTLSVFRSLIGPADCILGSTAENRQCKACRIQSSHLRCALADPSPSGRLNVLTYLADPNQTSFAATKGLSDPFWTVPATENGFQTYCTSDPPETIPLSPTLSPSVQNIALTLTGVPFAAYSVTPGTNLSRIVPQVPFHTKKAVDVGSLSDWDQLLMETCLGLGDTPDSYDDIVSQADSLYATLRLNRQNRSDLGALQFKVPLSLLELVSNLDQAETLALNQANRRVTHVSYPNQGIIVASQAQLGVFINTRLAMADPLGSCDTTDVHAVKYYIANGLMTIPYVIQHMLHQSFLNMLRSKALALYFRQVRGAPPRAGVLIQHYALGSPRYPTDLTGPEASLPDPWYPKGSTYNLTQPTFQQVIDQYLLESHPLTGLRKYTREQATAMAQQVFDTVNQVPAMAIPPNAAEKRAGYTILQPMDCTRSTWAATGSKMTPIYEWHLTGTYQDIQVDFDTSHIPGVIKPSFSYFSQRYGLDQAGQFLSKTGATSAFLTNATQGTVPSEAEAQVNGPVLAAIRGLQSSSPSTQFLTQHGGVLYFGGYLSCWLYSHFMRTTYNITPAQAGCDLPYSAMIDAASQVNPPSRALYLYDLPFYMVSQSSSLASRCDKPTYLSLQRGQLSNVTNLTTALYSKYILGRMGLGNLSDPEVNLTLPTVEKWDMFTIQDLYLQYNFTLGSETPLSVGTGYNPYCVHNLQPYLRQVAYTTTTATTSSTGVPTESLTCMGDPAEWQDTCWFLQHFQPIWQPAAPSSPAAAKGAEGAQKLEFPGTLRFEQVDNELDVEITLEFSASTLLKVPLATASNQFACDTNDLNAIYRMPFTSQAQVEFSVPLLDTDSLWLVRFTPPSLTATNYTNSCPESDQTFVVQSFVSVPQQDPRKIIPTPNCFPLHIILYRISPLSVPPGAARTAFATTPDLHFAINNSRDLTCWQWSNPDPTTLNRDAARLIQAQPSGIPVHYVLSGITDSLVLATRSWSNIASQAMGILVQLFMDVLTTHFAPNRTWDASKDADVFPINRTNPLAAPDPLEPDPSLLSTISDQMFPIAPPTSLLDPLQGNFTQQVVTNYTALAQNNMHVLIGLPSVNGNISTSNLSLTGQQLQDVQRQIDLLRRRKLDMIELLNKTLPAAQKALQVQQTLEGTIFTDDASFQALLDQVEVTRNLRDVNVGALMAAFQAGLIQNQSREDLICLAYYYVNIANRTNASDIYALIEEKYRERVDTNIFNRLETTITSNPLSLLNTKWLGGPGKWLRQILWTTIFQTIYLALTTVLTFVLLKFGTWPMHGAGRFVCEKFPILTRDPVIRRRFLQSQASSGEALLQGADAVGPPPVKAGRARRSSEHQDSDSSSSSDESDSESDACRETKAISSTRSTPTATAAATATTKIQPKKRMDRLKPSQQQQQQQHQAVQMTRVDTIDSTLDRIFNT
jgi:hypothetical protein